jgi:SAM-dependent methyltransferase
MTRSAVRRVDATFVDTLRRVGRDARYRPIHRAVARLARGHCVDVGGAAFVERATAVGASFDSWTVVEPVDTRLPSSADPRVRSVCGDGTRLPLRAAAADLVCAIHVLEHTFEPYEMCRELLRVCRPDGVVVLVVPQTANVHDLPHHYQNFTRYWVEEAADRLGAEIVEYRALGGAWSSVASRLVLALPSMFGAEGFRDRRSNRSPLFWMLLPLSLMVTAVVTPIALLLGLGDQAEEANNHLFVLRPG